MLNERRFTCEKEGARLKNAKKLLLACALICAFTLCVACAGPKLKNIPSVNRGDTETLPTESTEPTTETLGETIPTEETTEPTEPEETTEPTEPETSEPTVPETTEPKPTEPKPTEPKPTEPKPTEPEPTEPKPTEPEPTEPEVPPTTKPKPNPEDGIIDIPIPNNPDGNP